MEAPGAHAATGRGCEWLGEYRTILTGVKPRNHRAREKARGAVPAH
jgi:hypothetical protein